MSDQEIVAVVRGLLRVMEESREGFRFAAGATGSSDMKLLFTHYFNQCEQFIIELHQLADVFHIPMEATGVPSGEQSDFAVAFANGDMISLLAECEREEDHVMSEYRKAITMPLPPDLLHAVEAQGLEIKAAHDKLKYLAHLNKAA